MTTRQTSSRIIAPLFLLLLGAVLCGIYIYSFTHEVNNAIEYVYGAITCFAVGFIWLFISVKSSFKQGHTAVTSKTERKYIKQTPIKTHSSNNNLSKKPTTYVAYLIVGIFVVNAITSMIAGLLQITGFNELFSTGIKIIGYIVLIVFFIRKVSRPTKPV